jgi:tripartite-type tricarboxylate transporter receptor subunit TctC
MHLYIRRTVLSLAASSLAAAVLPLTAFAQTANAPATTKIVLPLPAGGGVDVFVRKLAEVMAKKMGSTVIVDNKPGASGQIAVQAVMTAPADASSILYLHSGILTAQAITGRMDVLRDFKPIGKVSSSPHVLVVAASAPYKTVADLIKAIQVAPDKLNYGSGGKGSPTHMMFAQMDEKLSGGLKATHIPFKGAIEGVVAIMSGSIDFVFAPPGAVQEQLKAGKLRALATTGKVRMPQLANVPTLAESGVTNYQDEPWGGLVVSAATSDAQVARLVTALKACIADPEIVDMINKVGGKIESSSSPAEFSAQIRDEIAANKVLVAKLGLKAE